MKKFSNIYASWGIRIGLSALIVFLFSLSGTHAQLILKTGKNYTPVKLVNNMLLNNDIQISNVTFYGCTSCYAGFDGRKSGLGMDSGILITTGYIIDVAHPNDVPNAGEDWMFPGDKDLEKIVGAPTHDASVLQFDFVPSYDTVQFNYRFGSEEYDEWVGSPFNDIFGFFVRGPGMTTDPLDIGKNIARLPMPDTGIVVTINNINYKSPYKKYYRSNAPNPDVESSKWIQFDGLTTLLAAKFPVERNSIYHIKIAIADVSDGIYDSGVFLEERSFTSTKSTYALLNVQATPNPDSSAQGFTIRRTMLDNHGQPDNARRIGDSLLVYYSLSGTAKINKYSGPYYVQDSVLIPAGQTDVTLSFSALKAKLPLYPNMIILTLDSLGKQGVKLFSKRSDTLQFHPLWVDAGADEHICQDRSIMLEASVPLNNSYSYKWTPDEGLSNPSIWNPVATPQTTTTYTVEVTDTAGRKATDQIKVMVLPFFVDAGKDVTIHKGVIATLTAASSEDDKEASYLWSPTAGLSNPASRITTADPHFTTTYTVLVTGPSCSGTDSVVVAVENDVDVQEIMPLSDTHSVVATPSASPDEIIVSYNVQTPGYGMIEIFDMMGKSVCHLPSEILPIGLHHTSCPVGHLTPGIYYVRVTLPDMINGTPIVVRH